MFIYININVKYTVFVLFLWLLLCFIWFDPYKVYQQKLIKQGNAFLYFKMRKMYIFILTATNHLKYSIQEFDEGI